MTVDDTKADGAIRVEEDTTPGFLGLRPPTTRCELSGTKLSIDYGGNFVFPFSLFQGGSKDLAVTLPSSLADHLDRLEINGASGSYTVDGAGCTELRVALASGRLTAVSYTHLEEGVTEVWGHCAINCPGRCALKFHVKDGEVLWVDTYSNPTNDLYDPQPRACLRGRSYRRWMNNPDRINYPMKRVEGTKRGDGQYEQIGWDEALQTIAEKLRHVIDTYGNEAVYNNYATGVSATTARPINRLMNLLGGRLGYYGSYSTAEIS